MKHKKRTNIKFWLIALSIFLLIIFFLVSIIILKPKNNTVSSIAYNVNKTEYRVYIKEGELYTPYLVLDNNYNYTGQTILLREHALSGEIMAYGGLGNDQPIHDGEMKMGWLAYKDTEVDNFLENDFSDYFDSIFINIVNDTIIDVEWLDEQDYSEIKRKFFLLSFQEISGEYSAYGKNVKKISYFNKDNLTITNDSGYEVTWWIRTPGWGDYMFVGYNNMWGAHSDTDAKRSVRPAFTMPGDITIKKEYLGDEIGTVYVIDY